MKGKLLVYFLAILGLSVACKEDGKVDYLPESVGAMNTLTVVIDNELWKSSVGDAIRENYTAAAPGLTWDEAQFSVTQIPQQIFTGSLQNTSAVLYIMEDTLNIAHMKSNMYAKPQKIGVIKGRNKEELITNIKKTAPEFIADFKALEIGKAQKRFEKSLNKEKALEDKFNIAMKIPSIYRVGREEDNFVWISREIQKGNMNIIAYTMPWDSFQSDSTFVQDIILMRDSIGKSFIGGEDIPGKNNHMITEKAFSPYVFPAEVSGKKAAEIRGIWEMSAYPMAGPFLTYIINDKENNRKLILEGFVFAPATKKRDYMFELEAILKSVRFNVKK
ncbi:DUF4837 family protein [Maribacter hydrothermalis]|uniref:DUF4837 domain-containing protein n=1 Tax=Maribacter hydrothermalis TaxID=1836467 RepID=A0A1B7ZE30_9FLAO|nr:DUF4837 family protein [Maribacter hydrothermalis]APQ17341.1 DUF4837 domain-containing protein [Maribacter hydrothermalis]OBR41819.1 DUF4837 domain-containing protein [Maribacter hydrothermalis]